MHKVYDACFYLNNISPDWFEIAAWSEQLDSSASTQSVSHSYIQLKRSILLITLRYWQIFRVPTERETEINDFTSFQYTRQQKDNKVFYAEFDMELF